jgi:hypothetical protein
VNDSNVEQATVVSVFDSTWLVASTVLSCSVVLRGWSECGCSVDSPSLEDVEADSVVLVSGCVVDSVDSVDSVDGFDGESEVDCDTVDGSDVDDDVDFEDSFLSFSSLSVLLFCAVDVSDDDIIIPANFVCVTVANIKLKKLFLTIGISLGFNRREYHWSFASSFSVSFDWVLYLILSLFIRDLSGLIALFPYR